MKEYKIIVIGGSAGSFQVVAKILSQLKANYKIPVVLCLHRLKHIKHGFVEALNLKSNLLIVEPEDKDPIKPGKGYLASANYHLFAELGNSFSLSTEEMTKFSRPSIDLTFETFSYVYKDKMVGIILSGANTDGCNGIAKCKSRGGYTIVQDLEEATIKVMPEGALKTHTPNEIWNTQQIIKFLNSL